MVARPLAVPIPRPFIAFGPTRLNLRASSVRHDSQNSFGHRSHWRIGEHVWHDEEADHRSPDVDLVELGDAAIPLRDGDLFQRDVQVVLGCELDVSHELLQAEGSQAHHQTASPGTFAPSSARR